MPENETPEKHQIVIVGGGAAGLELATNLGNALGKENLADITLLDASATHIWKPLLHEVAAGTLDESEQIDYLAQGYRNHFGFRLGKMEGLDRQKKEIQVDATMTERGELLIPKRTLNYDTLVLAVGSVSNTFNVKGVSEHCMFLDSTAQAFKFQKRLLETYIKNYVGNDTKTVKPLSIAIIGAGATGVELAAQLHEVTNVLATYGLKEPNNVKITIIEAANQLLPALPLRLAQATQKQLAALGISLKLGCRVTEISKDGIHTQSGEFIAADLKVWAAGIKAPDWLKNIDGLETNQINQVIVDNTLKTADDSIFALGDCAACSWPGHQGNVPPRAQAAHQQASILAQSLTNRLKNEPLVPFVYYDYGSLVSLGKYTTVGNLMGNLMGSVSIGGFIARIFYLSLYKMHQVALHGYFKTVLLTLSNLFRRSAFAKIKLH